MSASKDLVTINGKKYKVADIVKNCQQYVPLIDQQAVLGKKIVFVRNYDSAFNPDVYQVCRTQLNGQWCLFLIATASGNTWSEAVPYSSPAHYPTYRELIRCVSANDIVDVEYV